MQKMDEGLNELAAIQDPRPKEYAAKARLAGRKIRQASVLLSVDDRHTQLWRWSRLLVVAIEGYADELEKLP